MGQQGNLDKCAEQVINKHGIRSHKFAIQRLWTQLFSFARAIDAVLPDGRNVDMAKMQAKRVLDLACGSERVKVDPLVDKTRVFEPWLCRSLANIGATVTGVDVLYPRYVTCAMTATERKRSHFQKGQRYKVEKGLVEDGWNFVQRDLTQVGAIDRETFPDNSFDVVWCTAFVGACSIGADDPGMADLKRLAPGDYDIVLAEIEMQALRVLKDCGIFVFTRERMYRKSGGKFVFVKSLVRA